ncbi:hypothetical protein Tco_1526230 [Tanacetum coccineum]
MKKSSGFVKKAKHDQVSDSSDDEGNAYFREVLVVVGNDEMIELVMDLGGSYHMTHKRDFLYDFKGFDGGSVQLGDNRTCTINGTRKVKIQLHDGSSFILEDVTYVLGLRSSSILLGTLEKEGCTVKMQMGRINHGDLKQVRFKQLGSKKVGFNQLGFKQLGVKQVGFKQLGTRVKTRVHGVHVDEHVWFEVELQGAQRNREAEFFHVSNNDASVAQRWLQEKQLEEKTNTDCLVKEHEKGNVAEMKKVKESMKANLGKLLKYNA